MEMEGLRAPGNCTGALPTDCRRLPVDEMVENLRAIRNGKFL